MHGAAGQAADADLGITAWAHDAIASMSDLPGVHRVGLALAEGGGRRLRFTASERESESGVQWCHVDAYDDVPLNTAVRTGTAVLGALEDLDESYEEFVERQRDTPTVALAAAPLIAAGQTLGGFVLFFDQQQAFGPERRQELERVGSELGAALRRAQRTRSRHLVGLSDEPVPDGAVVAVHDVPPDPAAVARARRFLRGTLRDWGIDEETIDTAVLCLSELVTNAVIHTHADCVVRVLLEQGLLTTTVRDSGSPDSAAVEQLEEPLRVHGRGLQLVDVLASRWGSELDAVGTTVWFALET